MPSLFDPVQLGAIRLPNRIVMAPLTRSRAGQERVPNALMAEYYRQRATAGLIVSEGSQIGPLAIGYPDTPGCYLPEHTAGWRLSTSAVHQADGRIVLQLWHVGRISHPLWLDGQSPVAPSAIGPTGDTRTPDGLRPFEPPRALSTDEVRGVVAEFRHAAQVAKDAGFDGVEIHGANGYIIDQFLRDGTNVRTDEYGGSPENRCRFALEVLDAVAEVWGYDRVGLRLNPHGLYRGMTHTDLVETYRTLAARCDERHPAFLHVVGALDRPDEDQATPAIREAFSGPLVVCGGYDRDRADRALALGADLVAFGTLFIANPDLPARLECGLPLTEADRESYYTPGPKGYTDYPAWIGTPGTVGASGA